MCFCTTQTCMFYCVLYGIIQMIRSAKISKKKSQKALTNTGVFDIMLKHYARQTCPIGVSLRRYLQRTKFKSLSEV